MSGGPCPWKLALAIASLGVVVATSFGALGALGTLGALGAPTRSTLEVWGLAPGDALAIDGAPVIIKPGLARGFTGQPLPEDAPARVEVAAGSHTLVLRRGACSEQTVRVETQGSYKRSLVFAPISAAHCAVPAMPPRAR